MSCHFWDVKTTWGTDSYSGRPAIHTGMGAYPNTWKRLAAARLDGTRRAGALRQDRSRRPRGRRWSPQAGPRVRIDATSRSRRSCGLSLSSEFCDGTHEATPAWLQHPVNGRNRVRVVPDPRTGVIQIEWRENRHRVTRSPGHRDWIRAKMRADEVAATWRKFASDLMDQTLKVLCELGGWKTAQTVLRCYQRADQARLRKALEHRARSLY